MVKDSLIHDKLDDSEVLDASGFDNDSMIRTTLFSPMKNRTNKSKMPEKSLSFSFAGAKKL